MTKMAQELKDNLNRNVLMDLIQHGDVVHFLDKNGKIKKGWAQLRGPYGWVLNMGGKYGTPALPQPDRIVKVIRRHMNKPNEIIYSKE